MDLRYDAAILTPQQGAALTGLPLTTLRGWMRRSDPVVRALPNERRGWPTIPLVGLIEAHVGQHLIERGYSKQRAVLMLRSLRDRGELDYIEQIPQLLTDKSHVFVKDGEDLTRIDSGQGAFPESLAGMLEPIVTVDGQVKAFDPPRAPFTRVSPGVNGGSLTLTNSRVPAFAVVGSLQAGSDVPAVAKEFEVDEYDVQRISDDLDWFALAA